MGSGYGGGGGEANRVIPSPRSIHSLYDDDHSTPGFLLATFGYRFYYPSLASPQCGIPLKGRYEAIADDDSPIMHRPIDVESGRLGGGVGQPPIDYSFPSFPETLTTTTNTTNAGIMMNSVGDGGVGGATALNRVQ